MLAAFYTKSGPARDVFHVAEVSVPQPGRGEVRVRVHTSGINPADVKRRGGEPGRPLQFPVIIPHSDGAGIIEAVGPEVSASREGDTVWLWNTQWRRPFGTAAQYAVLPSAQAVSLPAGADYELGAALGVPALTAHRCVTLLGEIRDRHLLLLGGAGMIGQIATRIAKARGANVTTTVSDDERAAISLQAGADHVLNYQSESFLEEAQKTSGSAGFDFIVDVDMGANGRHYSTLLRKFGTVVVYGSATNMLPSVDVLALQLNGVTLSFVSGSEQSKFHRNQAIAEVTDLIQDGRLVVRTEARYGLEDIASAHERVEAGRLTGKVLLSLPAS